MSERRYSPLATLFAATFLFRIGNAVAALALPWFVLSHTKSAAWAGATAASSVIATIIGAWVGGGLVDRFGRAPVALISGVVGGVAMASIPLLDAVGALSNTGLIACVVLGAAFDAPGMAAQDSELPKLGHVAGLSVERVSSLKAVIGNVAILGGPALGGAAIGLLGAAPTLGLTAFCSVLAGLLGAWVLPARAARTMTTTATLHARRRRFSLERTLLRPLFGIVMIFVGIVGANGSVIMPALFVDAGRQVAELGLFSSMMGAGGLLGIAIHASVGARISAQNWLAVAFCGSAVGSLLLSQLPRAGADVVGRARGTADRLSLSHSQRCHLQPHAARTSRPGTRHGLGGDAVSLAHGYACGRRVCRPCWSAHGLVVSAVFAGLVALLSLRLQFATMAAAASLRPNPYRR
ncbi:MFS transporter [Enterobacter hormaechei]|uniref:MFS transporter n=1 Tax=Enterobacter hormaechei TaxID=158836 RepID=UPI00311AAD08